MGKTQCLVASVMVGIAGMTGCSKTTVEPPQVAASSGTPSLVAKPPARMETITLRGIPFDEDDVRQKLTEMCIADATRNGRKAAEVKKNGLWCTFIAAQTMLLPNFQYGNLTRSTGYASVDERGVLLRFEASGPTGEMLVLANALEDKYGKPVVTASATQNKMGATFEKMTFEWTDDPGTTITLESMYNRIDEGRVVIESRSYQTAKALRAKIARELNKSKL